MKWALLLIPAIWLATLPVSAQPLSVYSEFARIDAQGNVVAPETPREIISPALIRNGFTSFQVVVQIPANTPYTLSIGQNPDNAAEVTLYRTVDSRLNRVANLVEGYGPEVFWMEVWIDKDAPVRRIKVEPELFVNGDWVIYPMEMRVRENVVPEFSVPPGGVRAWASSSFEMLRAFLCAPPPPPRTVQINPPRTQGSILPPQGAAIQSVDDLHAWNAWQDVGLASLVSTADRDELRKRMGGCNARAPENPEFYLRLRDYFVTPLWVKIEQGK